MTRQVRVVWPLSLALLLFCIEGLSGAFQPSKGPCRFELHGCTLRPDVVDFLNRAVLQLNRDYRESFDMAMHTNPTIRIRIFGTVEDFRSFCSTNHPRAGKFSAFYSEERDDITTWQQARADKLVGILLHEASHALLQQYLGRTPPLWLNEGLAEYMACVHMARTPSGPAHQNFRLAKCKEMLEANRFPSLNGLMSLKYNRFDQQDADESYSATWSLVCFLRVSQPRDNPYLKNLMTALHKRTIDPMGASDFLDENYPGGLARLESDWKVWMKTAIRFRKL